MTTYIGYVPFREIPQTTTATAQAGQTVSSAQKGAGAIGDTFKGKPKISPLGAVAGVAIAGILLYSGVENGKLKKIENPKGFKEKANNIAYDIGSLVKKGFETITGANKKTKKA